jgi:hypothetical protein
MLDLVQQDQRVHVSTLAYQSRCKQTHWCLQGARVFSAPDGMLYRWTPSANSRDVQVSIGISPWTLVLYLQSREKLMDPNGNVVAIYRPTRPTRYQIGDVHGELHFFPQSGACTVVRPSYLVSLWHLSANFLLSPPSSLPRCILP